jgi:hypothetical protein
MGQWARSAPRAWRSRITAARCWAGRRAWLVAGSGVARLRRRRARREESSGSDACIVGPRQLEDSSFSQHRPGCGQVCWRARSRARCGATASAWRGKSTAGPSHSSGHAAVTSWTALENIGCTLCGFSDVPEERHGSFLDFCAPRLAVADARFQNRSKRFVV